MVAYSAATLVAIAAALAFGWIDPNPGVITTHIERIIRLAIEHGKRPVWRFVRREVSMMSI
jgi:hypothetical protein